MRTEIFIEGFQADLTDDVAALFSYAVDDIADFSSRETAQSKTLVFPGTARNNQLFGHAFEYTVFNDYDASQPNVGSNFNAAKSAKCIVLTNGVQVFKGVLRLLEIKINKGIVEYETFLVGELGGFMSAIGTRLLTGNANIGDDLDFSAYNQTWTFGNIASTWGLLNSGGGGSGLFYPLIDYGNVTVDRINFKYHALRPALYVREYIMKIIEKAGYTVDCPFFDTAFFKRLIIPHNEDNVYKLTRSFINQYSTWQPGILNHASAGTGGTTGPVMPIFSDQRTPRVNFSNSKTVGIITFTDAFFTYTGSASAVVRASALLRFTTEGGQGMVMIFAQLKVNGVVKAAQSFTLVGFVAGVKAHSHLVLALDDYTMAAGDYFSVELQASYLGSPTFGWSVDLDADSRFMIAPYTKAATDANLGDTLEINNCIPKGVLQRDFFMSIAKMFNLYIFEDPDRDKHLRILPFPDFFDNSDPLDWTHKIDRSKEISLKPMSEVNARYFNFQYEKDTDFDNEIYYNRYATGYGDRAFDSGLDFVKEKADLKVIFAPSPLVGVTGLDKAVTRIMKVDSSGAEARTGSRIRILQAKRISVSSWNVLQADGTTVITSTTFYGYAGHVDDPSTPQGADLNFGAPQEIYWVPSNPYAPTNLFNGFYSSYMAEITDKDSKLLSCFVRLSPVDIANLDFARAIVIDGQLWRLNKVSDFDAVEEGVTRCEFLRVINLSYNG